MKKLNTIGLVIATTIVCEVGIALVRNKIIKEVVNERYKSGEKGMKKDKGYFEPIILETRKEANEVLNLLLTMVTDYGQASIADLYDLVGITSKFTDNEYGWLDLSNASITIGSNGYSLNLPKAKILE